jgi:3-hydroxybutyrate dehydrogenase
VKALSGAGANIVVADLDGSGLQDSGVDCKFVRTNVADAESVRALIDEVEASLGGADILVNNAGIQFLSPVVDFPEERWNALLGVILTGTFLCSKHALPYMLSRRWGRIINIASLHAKVASPFKSAYVSAKHGVLGFTKTLALEVAEQNITCNAICPAYVRTPLVEKQIADQAIRHHIAPEEVITRIMTEPAAIKRLLEPDEVASLALYLCSDAAAGITGAALDIDLGWTAR